jgi:hypothetical protein
MHQNFFAHHAAAYLSVRHQDSRFRLPLFLVYTIIQAMTKSSPSKRGRPPKPDSASEVLPPVRVTPEQKETYKEAAKFVGLSLSAWLKEAAEDKLSRQLESGA